MSALLAIWMFCSVAFGAQLDEIPNPASQDAWLTDQAGVLSAEESKRISALAESMYRDLGVDVVLVTVAQVNGGTPKELATALFNKWRPGDPQANNGLLILFSLGDRRLEMETGYGLESLLPDGWIGTMQQEFMVPAFKEGHYGEGLLKGMQHVDARLRLNPEAARLGAPAPVYDPNPPMPPPDQVYEYNPWLDSELMPIYGGAGGGLVLVAGATFYIRRRRRSCLLHDSSVRMERLSEVDEDEHLNKGQVMEESLGAVEHDVFMCPQCSATKVFSRSLLFSGYGRCPKCARRTTSKTRSNPYGGRVHIHTKCKHCGHSSSRVRIGLAGGEPSDSIGSNSRNYGRSARSASRRSTSSSSRSASSSSRSSSRSSSSRSSSRRSGGGRSGGGGAGSSW